MGKIEPGRIRSEGAGWATGSYAPPAGWEMELRLHEVYVQDHPSAALVCRDWALAARGPLYAHLTDDN